MQPNVETGYRPQAPEWGRGGRSRCPWSPDRVLLLIVGLEGGAGRFSLVLCIERVCPVCLSLPRPSLPRLQCTWVHASHTCRCCVQSAFSPDRLLSKTDICKVKIHTHTPFKCRANARNQSPALPSDLGRGRRDRRAITIRSGRSPMFQKRENSMNAVLFAPTRYLFRAPQLRHLFPGCLSFAMPSPTKPSTRHTRSNL